MSQQHDGEHSIESNNDGEQRPLALPEAPANADQTTRRAGRAVLIGEVVRVTRACDPHDGDPSGSEWVIGTIAAADRLARYRFVGVGLPSLRTGGTARLTGYWEDHPEYGPQFRALEAQCQAPRNPDALARYIAANVPYCGPSRATRLIETFGAEVLTVLQRQPDRVREVFGGRLGTKLVKGWLWWAETSGDDAAAQRLEVLFLTAGGSAGNARRAVRFFRSGEVAEAIAQRHPYRLTEVPGIRFARADQIARAVGFKATHPERLTAGLTAALEEAASEGHSALPTDQLIERAARLLDLPDRTAIRNALASADDDGFVRIDNSCGSEDQACRIASRTNGRLVFLPASLDHEWDVAERLAELAASSRQFTVAEHTVVGQTLAGLGLSDEQELAVRAALQAGVSVLTGRPGAGKTTALRGVVQCCEALGWSVSIAAPTGKAAARAAEVTGAPTSTVHRLLGGAVGSRRDTPLTSRLLIVDEASMLDLETMAWLLDSVHAGATSLLIVGDPRQLPSVGPGNVLRDIIASGTVPVTTLERVFRQGAESEITANANALIDGRPLSLTMLHPGATGRALRVVSPTDSAGERSSECHPSVTLVLATIRWLATERGARPDQDVQVLAPTNRGAVGVDALNVALQRALNPHGAPGPLIGDGKRVRVGDRVVQTRNDYTVEGGFFNGEQGTVISADLQRETVSLRLDAGGPEGRTLTLQGVSLLTLRLAWAITVHRAQGAEFAHVVLACAPGSDDASLHPALLYTALTRARRTFVLVGAEPSVGPTTRLNPRHAERFSGLAGRLMLVASSALDSGCEESSDGS